MQGKMVQNSIKYGSGPSLILDAQERSTGELKPKHEWDKANNEGSETNAKALFSIFIGVYLGEFRRIVNGKCAKEAWDILQVTIEGTSSIKISKWKMIATRFENIRMHENQTLSSFFLSNSMVVR